MQAKWEQLELESMTRTFFGKLTREKLSICVVTILVVTKGFVIVYVCVLCTPHAHTQHAHTHIHTHTHNKKA